MKNKERLMRVLMTFVVIINFFNLVTSPIPYRVKFDKSIAEGILKGAYLPLENFVKSGIPTEDEEFDLVHDDIRNKEDFKRLFTNKTSNRMAEDFFEDLIVEKQGELYIDNRVYIPNIYLEGGKLTSSYIKRSQKLKSIILGKNEIESEELVIKERWKISGEWRIRRNYFVKNEDGEWILDHFTGTGYYKLVEVSHNPWSYY